MNRYVNIIILLGYIIILHVVIIYLACKGQTYVTVNIGNGGLQNYLCARSDYIEDIHRRLPC